jgi:hypothetical protein
MHLTQRTIIAAAAAMAMVVSAGPAVAHGYNGDAMFVPESHDYSGSWPVTVTRSQFGNGTGCLTLTSNSSSGSASLVFGSKKYVYGSFVVVDHILMATIIEQLYGQNGALTFTASASRGHVGEGIYENIEGGSNFDFGALTFGMKNGC